MSATKHIRGSRPPFFGIAACLALCLTAALSGTVTAQGPDGTSASAPPPPTPYKLRAPFVCDLFRGQFEQPEPPRVNRPDPALVTSRVRDGRLRLALRDVLELVVRNGLGVQVQRYDVLDSRQAVFQAFAPFEPVWTQQFYASRDTAPSASSLQGAKPAWARDVFYDGALSKYMPTGTTLWGDINFRRYENNTLTTIVNPSLTTNWTLGVTQHLLRGFGRDVNEAPVYVARNSFQTARWDFQSRLEYAVLEAQKAYWDILLAQTELGVRKDSLSLAEKTYSDLDQQVKAGVQPELGLYKAGTEVARRRQELIATETVLKNLRQRLVSYLTPESSVVEGEDFQLELEEMDPQVDEVPMPQQEALARAVRERPEMKAAELGVSSAEINLRAARNRLKPLFDVSLSYTQHGMKGDVLPTSSGPIVIPPETLASLQREFNGNFWQSIGESFTGKYNGFKLQANVTIPIGNVDARASAARASIAAERQRTGLDQVRQQVVLSVLTVYNTIKGDRAYLEAASEALRQAEKDVEGEQAKFEAGISVIRDLIDAQRNLSQARSQESFARVQYRKSMLEYYRSTGQILERCRIVPSDAFGAGGW